MATTMSLTDQLLEQISRDLRDFHNSLQRNTNDLRQTVPIFTNFQKAAIAASVATTALVASAGGPAWRTFTGSIELVGMQIARLFIPSLIAASIIAQDFASWLEDLGPEARDTLVGLAKLAAGAAAVYVALNFLTNPIVLLTGAVLAAVIALKMLPDILEWIGEQWRRIRGEGGNPLNPIKEPGFLKDFMGGFLGGPAFLGDRIFGNQPLPWDKNRNFADVFQESLKKNIGFDVNKLVDLFSGATNIPGQRSRERQPLKFDWVRELQPRFSSVEEARKQFQIGALMSPLEQENLKYQRQMARDFVGLVPKIREFLDKVIAGWFGFR